MINPKLLTKEYGFEPGVVVEFLTVDGFTLQRKITKRGETCFFFDDYSFPMYGFENLQSIRPLTGPMAIWNFAPDNSDVLLTSGQMLYRFFTSEEWSKWKNMMYDGEHDTVSTRPWWAK